MTYQRRVDQITFISEENEIKELFVHETHWPKGIRDWIIIGIITAIIIIVGTIFISLLIYLLNQYIPINSKIVDRNNRQFLINSGFLFLIFMIFFIPIGYFSGLLWAYCGKRLNSWCYYKSLKKLHNQPKLNRITSWFLRSIIGGSPNQVFLGLEAKDTNLSSHPDILDNTIKLIFVYLAILMAVLKIFFPALKFFASSFDIKESVYLFPIYLICFFLALWIMAFYQPFSLIIEDAKLMIINENGTIKHIGSSLRNTIGGFFGVFGLISGFQLFQDQGFFTRFSPLITFLLNLILFFTVILISSFLVAPIIFPAVIVYFRKHSKLVNDFRNEIIEIGIPIAVTSGIKLNPEELNMIDSSKQNL